MNATLHFDERGGQIIIRARAPRDDRRLGIVVVVGVAACYALPRLEQREHEDQAKLEWLRAAAKDNSGHSERI